MCRDGFTTRLCGGLRIGPDPHEKLRIVRESSTTDISAVVFDREQRRVTRMSHHDGAWAVRL